MPQERGRNISAVWNANVCVCMCVHSVYVCVCPSWCVYMMMKGQLQACDRPSSARSLTRLFHCVCSMCVTCRVFVSRIACYVVPVTPFSPCDAPGISAVTTADTPGIRSISAISTSNTPSARSTEYNRYFKYSKYLVCSEYEVYWEHPWSRVMVY